MRKLRLKTLNVLIGFCFRAEGALKLFYRPFVVTDVAQVRSL